MGEVITFYSYKGGTGRTMAMANVAWILAASGKRVLMVDWDLEAPGLHRYFYPFLRDKDLVTSTGIIDIVMDFAIQATTPASNANESDKAWYLPYADVIRHAVSIDWAFGAPGRLDLLPAGQQNAAYASKVNSFNWDNFYERLGGGTFLNALRDSMVHEYDYVLIDSRTGVSDTSGICTVQIPDKVVVCFTLNRQSIEGAASVARSVVQSRARAGRPALRLFPVVTRVEKAETLRLEAARTAARARFDDLLDHVPSSERPAYWNESEIAYQPYYAYEEELATFSDGSILVGSLLRTIEALAARLIGAPNIAWERPTPEARAEVRAKYSWAGPPAPEAPAALPTPPPEAPVPLARVSQERVPLASVARAPVAESHTLRDARSSARVSPDDREFFEFFVSYATGDMDAHLTRFVADLEEEVRSRLGRDAHAFIDRNEFDVGGDHWARAIGEGLARSRTAVCLVTPHYVQSDYCGRVFSAILQRQIPILPVLWAPVRRRMPAALGRIKMGGPESGLKAMLQVRRYESAYRQLVSTIAAQITHGGSAINAPVGPTDWSNLSSAFQDSAPTDVGGRVLIACLAPTRAIAKQLDLAAGTYGASEWDWRPFGSSTIRDLVERVAADELFEIELATVDDALLGRVDEASRTGRMTLLFAESSTIQSSSQQSLVHLVNVSSLVHLLMIVSSPTATGPLSAGEFLAVKKGDFGGAVVLTEDQLTAAIRSEFLAVRAQSIRRAATQRPVTSSGVVPKLSQ